MVNKCFHLGGYRLTQSHNVYRSLTGSHFYVTENVNWAVFEPPGNTEKKVGPIMSNF